MGRFLLSVLVCGLLAGSAHAQTNWPRFGNDPGAERYSPLKQINTRNVDQLQVAWTFDTTVANPQQPAALGPMHGDSASPQPARRRFRIFGCRNRSR